MEELTLKVNAPTVIAEVIDGEAVIMNMATGHYFSCLGVGGEIWSNIEAGATPSVIRNSLLIRYAVEPSALDEHLAGFMADLRKHDLIREEPGAETPSEGGDPSATPATSPSEPSGLPFDPPVLNVYSDMEDLLLLDPIHDVDETGWPAPKPEDMPPAPEGSPPVAPGGQDLVGGDPTVPRGQEASG